MKNNVMICVFERNIDSEYLCVEYYEQINETIVVNYINGANFLSMITPYKNLTEIILEMQLGCGFIISLENKFLQERADKILLKSYDSLINRNQNIHDEEGAV